jgi:DNA-binding winged helix-turn-helix (wHTH) protein/Tfp pilus assembly protein PilF
VKQPAILYAFGPYTVEAASRRLLRDREVLPLNGKAFDLLLAFLESGGSVLSREALYERLWPTADVEDGNLTQNVYLIRRALDRSGNGPPYIETLPRYGYRFCAPVSRGDRAVTPRKRAGTTALLLALVASLVLGLGGSSTIAGTSAPPKDREALALGVYHLRMRRPADLHDARDYFERAVRIAPQQPDGYAGLASTYALLAEYYAPNSRQQQHDVELARGYVDAALRRNPGDSDALAAAGFIAYRFDGDGGQAQTDLQRALSADPNNAAAHHWLGVLNLVEGNTRAAVDEMEAAHALEPTSEIFSRWLARAYAFAGRPRDALDLVSVTLSIENDDEAAMLVRASAQEELGDLRGALKTLRELGAHDATEQPFVEPDEARLEAMLYRNERKALISRVTAAVAASRADAYEAFLFYLTVGRRDRADALLHTIHGSLTTAGLQANDPRYKHLTADPS